MKYVKPIVRILLSITLVVMLVLAFVKMPRQRCEHIQVVAHTQNESVVLSQAGVEALLADAKIEIIGKEMKEIDLGEIATLLKNNPFIETVNFVHFAGKRLVIDYTLREIVLHVFTSNGEHYFVDNKGIVVPFTMKMKDYLMIVNGNVSDNFKAGRKAPGKIQDALALAQKINQNDFYQAQFRQIYINNRNEMELTTTVGGQTILFGDLKNADEKLENLKTVYENGLSHKGYNTYAQLDARYKNRIIATRK
jgi:cell division protein FtsQ